MRASKYLRGVAVKNDNVGRVSLVVLVDQECSVDAVGEAANPLSILPLLGQFCRFDVPITWAAEDPAHSAFVHQVQKVAAWHEVAIWASASWVRWHAMAGRAADELERRRRDAWRASVPVTSVVLSDVLPTDVPWLAGARNFAVVSGCPMESWRSPAGVPSAAGSSRFGEGPWLASRVVRLHSPTLWTRDADALGAKFQVCQTAKEGGTTVVLAKLSELAESSTGALQVLEMLQQLETSGSLKAVSLGDCRPSPKETRAKGQRSALRPAA
jgi:hypothetical protein